MGDTAFIQTTVASDIQIDIQWLPCKAPGVKGSGLGLVGQVSVHSDWIEIESLMCSFYPSVAARTIV